MTQLRTQLNKVKDKLLKIKVICKDKLIVITQKIKDIAFWKSVLDKCKTYWLVPRYRFITVLSLCVVIVGVVFCFLFTCQKKEVSTDIELPHIIVEPVTPTSTPIPTPIPQEEQELTVIFSVFNDITQCLEQDNYLLTYSSVTIDTFADKSALKMQIGKQGENNIITISANKHDFSLYRIDQSLYVGFTAVKDKKYYKVVTEDSTEDYWNTLYNEEEDLKGVLSTYDFTELKHLGTVRIENNECNKYSAIGNKKEGISSISTSQIYRSNSIPTDVMQAIQENKLAKDEDALTFANLNNFNLSAETALFTFYIDKLSNKILKLEIDTNMDKTIIDITKIKEISLPQTVKIDNLQLIDDDKLGRLMLSNIFAMVSDNSLNELTDTLGQEQTSMPTPVPKK